MTDLEDTFGESFVEDYKQTIAERREQRNSVDEKTKREIANQAVNEGKLDGEEPHFTYTTEEGVTHDVMLMQLPDPNSRSIFSYTNDLDSGAVTCPLDYLDEWMSCLFNDREVLKQMEPGQHYIVIGNLDQWENNQGEMQDQMSPVRGVMTLEEASAYAEEALEESGINDAVPEEEEDSEEEKGAFAEAEAADEESEEPEDDEEEGEPSSGSMFSGSSGDSEDEEEEEEEDLGFLDEGDEEEEDEGNRVYDEVALRNLVDKLGEKEDAVWEVEEGDARADKLAKVVAKRHDDFEVSDSEDVEFVKDKVLDYIEEVRSEDEEEDLNDEEENLFG